VVKETFTTEAQRTQRAQKTKKTKIVIPAKAGIHGSTSASPDKWIPAFAGMTTFE